MGVIEGGQDRPHNRAGALGEHAGNDKPLAEGNDDNHDEYDKDGTIPDNDDKYTVGVDGVDEPLDEGVGEYDSLSATPARVCCG